MGQRLNIEINKSGKTLANAYYHWSAYTSSSLELLEKIIDYIDETDAKSDIEKAVRLLEITGAGISDSEITMLMNDPIQEKIDFKMKLAVDRNEGLIAVTKEGIDKTREWEEGRVTIDIEDFTFSFEVLFRVNKEDYLDCYDEEEYERLERIEEEPDFYDVPFDRFFKLKDFIERYENGVILPDGDVLKWIE